MKLTIFSLFLTFCYVEANFCKKEYENISTATTRDCCDYPGFNNDYVEPVRECTKACDVSDSCCRIDCIYITLKLYDEEEFQKETLFKLLTNASNDEHLNQWKDVIDQSIEKCQKISEFFIKVFKHLFQRYFRLQVPQERGMTNEEDICKSPFYVFFNIACVFQENFLSCPTFNSSDECKTLVDYINGDPCGYLKGDTKIVNTYFWN